MNPIQKIKTEGGQIKREVKTRTLGYITGGLGLVAGLAWNDAIRALIDYWIPAGRESVSAKMLYAVVITLVVVVMSMYVSRLLTDQESKV